MNKLVEFLSKGKHPVIAFRAQDVAELKQSIDRGFVLIKFTDTEGGTELGIEIDDEKSRYDEADFDKGEGAVYLSGSLMLNYDKVELTANIDLHTLSGEGSLTLLAEEADWRSKSA